MKKIALTFLVILLLMAGVGAGVYLVRQQTEFREKAAPASTIALVPSKTSPSVDETFTVAADINTGSNSVLAVEMHVTFDETKVEAIGASNSTFFTAPKNVGPSIDNNNGTLTYTVYIDPGTAPRQGQGTVATFTFRAKASGNTTVALSSETNVGADDSTGDLGVNVLSGTTPAILTIQGSTAPTPTPTVVQQSTNTPTPTGPTRTPTPTTIGSVSAATITPTDFLADITITTAPDELPDSGMSIPMSLGVGVGVVMLLGSMLLAL
jgi:hypothetical protein